ncbi:MAG: prolyl oligopeptidase family serine peptidase [Actinomycetia bacterium]|nr:prolyl oligopeptidase family serine peptidase [Actinomycetes bacterium]
MTSDDVPRWEQRLRAPQIPPWTLLGSAAVWPRDVSSPAVVMANLSGRVEAHVYEPGDEPSPLTQVTDRPQGTLGAAMTPDGAAVLWFDDTGGSEVGRWVRQPRDGGASTVLAADLPSGFMAGIAPTSDGGGVVGYLGESGMTIISADPTGAAHVVTEFPDAGQVATTDGDEQHVLVAVAPGGDWQRMGARVIRLTDGVTTAERFNARGEFLPVGFDPADASRVLVVDNSGGQPRPALWDLAEDQLHELSIDLDGDIAASWYPNGSALLVTALHNARHTLHRFEIASGELKLIPTPSGCIGAASARPNGEVHALVSSAAAPPMVFRLVGGDAEPLVELPGPLPPSSTTVEDVFVEGPGGTVHALLRLPQNASGSLPMVVAVHGGPTFQDYDLWNTTVASYVDLGYAVLSVNYRGSTGYGAAWREALHGRLGFIELEDVTAVLDHLVSQGVVDAGRLSIAGGSWGGFLTLMAVGTQPERWRSGIALVPVADQAKCAEVSPRFMQSYLESLFGGTIKEIPEVFEASSPITYVGDVRAPLFVSAGVNDPRCPVEQIDTYVEALRAAGGDVHYHRIDTGHAVPDVDTMVDELALFLDFLIRTNPPG